MYFQGAFRAYLYKNKDLAKVTSLSYQIRSFKSSFILSVPQVTSCFKLQQEVFLNSEVLNSEGRKLIGKKIN